MAYAVAMAVLLPMFLLFGTERFSALARLCGWIGLAGATLPAVLLLHRPNSRMNSVAATGLVLALYYHVAVFHERRLILRWGEARISEASVDLAMIIAALTVPALWLGWYLGGLLQIWRALPRPRLEVPGGILGFAGLGLSLLALSADLLWLRGDLTTYQPAVSLISTALPLELGVAMMVVRQVSSDVTRRERFFFWGVMALIMSFSLARGMILVMVRPFMVYLLGWLYLSRRARLVPVLLALLSVLLMQPVKGEFRQRVWDRPVSLGFVERTSLFLELMAEHWLGGEFLRETDKAQSLEVAASRTGGVMALANVVELTPASVPHQGGATYRYLLYAFIPRVLYPDKPIAQYADVWAAVMYGYTTERGMRNVMVGLSQLAESYINFGLLGGLLMLVFTGVLYRGVDEVMGRAEAGSGAHAVYLHYLSSLMVTMDGSFGQIWGGVLQSLLLYGTFMAVLGTFKGRRGR